MDAFAASLDLERWGSSQATFDQQGTSHMRPSPVSSLDIVMTLMREHWAAGEGLGAAVMAKVAAPFAHPRAHASRIQKHLGFVIK